MLSKNDVQRLLPGAADCVEDGVLEYYKYANRAGVSYEQLEKECGVVAIEVQAL